MSVSLYSSSRLALNEYQRLGVERNHVQFQSSLRLRLCVHLDKVKDRHCPNWASSQLQFAAASVPLCCTSNMTCHCQYSRSRALKGRNISRFGINAITKWATNEMSNYRRCGMKHIKLVSLSTSISIPKYCKHITYMYSKRSTYALVTRSIFLGWV